MRPTIWTIITREIRKVVSLYVAHNVWLLLTIIITITALVRIFLLNHFKANLLIPINSNTLTNKTIHKIFSEIFSL